MKKTGIILSAAFLLATAFSGVRTEAVFAESKDDLSTLVRDYLGKDGVYTKKTTIGLSDQVREDNKEYFHQNLTQAERTTYYNGQKLLLADADGVVQEGSGSYYCDGSAVYRTHAVEVMDNEIDFSLLEEEPDFKQQEAKTLEECYVTLNTFLAENYFSGWGYNETTREYYYDITDKGSHDGIYNCSLWNDFQNFCAPMLYINPVYLTGIKSITIKENAAPTLQKFLQITMYLDESESGKLAEGKSYFAQARIYKGNSVFEENFKVASVTVTRGQEADSLKMTYNADEKQFELKNVPLQIGDKIKVYDFERGWQTAYSHDISNFTAVKTDDYSNYVVMYAGNYDFYYKPSDGKTYIVCPETLTVYFAKPNNWTDWTGTFYYYAYNNDDDKVQAWPGVAMTEVSTNYEYESGNFGSLYSFNMSKSNLNSYKYFIIDCTGKQTDNLEIAWYNNYSFNCMVLHYDNKDTVKVIVKK